jgi:hypothetical protein
MYLHIVSQGRISWAVTSESGLSIFPYIIVTEDQQLYNVHSGQAATHARLQEITAGPAGRYAEAEPVPPAGLVSIAL